MESEEQGGDGQYKAKFPSLAHYFEIGMAEAQGSVTKYDGVEQEFGRPRDESACGVGTKSGYAYVEPQDSHHELRNHGQGNQPKPTPRRNHHLCRQGFPVKFFGQHGDEGESGNQP